MTGHKGSKCYFPVDKGGKQSHTIGNQPEPEKPSKPDVEAAPTLLSTVMSFAKPAEPQASDVTNQELPILGDRKVVTPAKTLKPTHTKKPRATHLADGAATIPQTAPIYAETNFLEAFEALNRADRYARDLNVFDAWARGLF